jgi:hypothetical protein
LWPIRVISGDAVGRVAFGAKQTWRGRLRDGLDRKCPKQILIGAIWIGYFNFTIAAGGLCRVFGGKSKHI